MPHEQSFLSSVLSVWEDQLTVMRLFFSLVHPLLRASGKDKAMKRIPKTPVEFDYDLWTTEDGKCMVRVKATGETTEVDREVMKALRNEEKKLRRSYTVGGASDKEDGEERQSSTILSLDAAPDEDVRSSSWLTDPKNYSEEIVTGILIEEFKLTLTSLHLSVFENCVMNGMTVREYAATFGISKSYASKIEKAVKEKLKNFFEF
jgi:hypothetical protein